MVTVFAILFFTVVSNHSTFGPGIIQHLFAILFFTVVLKTAFPPTHSGTYLLFFKSESKCSLMLSNGEEPSTACSAAASKCIVSWVVLVFYGSSPFAMQPDMHGPAGPSHLTQIRRYLNLHNWKRGTCCSHSGCLIKVVIEIYRQSPVFSLVTKELF